MANANELMSAWEKVKTARSNERPTSLDYIAKIFDSFVELHGDRLYRDDGAIVGGIAKIEDRYVTVIGQQKGRSIKQNMKRNFGMANPDGYRKALRLMKQAEKFGRPVICFVDTPGAFCGIEAEERGQGEAIARNLFEMSALKVPVLSIVIGEGGSGGALGLAVANEVWMLQNATYSILSPEGFASILWKDSKKADEAAAIMKITADDLKELHIIEQVVAEIPFGTGSDAAEKEDEKTEAGAENQADAGLKVTNMDGVASELRKQILGFVERYSEKDGAAAAEERYQRFRRL